jgi:phage protein D
MAKGRRAIPAVSYSGGAARLINDRLSEFTYDDPAAGESDSCTVTVHDADGAILDALPARGDKMTTSITLTNWDGEGDSRTIICGTFCCDQLEFSGWPTTCAISGTSVPEKQAFRTTQRSKTWEDVTISGIAGAICGTYGLSLSYDAPSYQISYLEQSEAIDADFLEQLCEDYGLCVKIYSGRVVIYDPVRLEARPSVRTIDIKQFSEWGYTGQMQGVYTGATIQYTDGSEEEEYVCQVGGGNRILALSDKVDSLAEARVKALAAVNLANREEETLTGTLPGGLGLCSTQCVTITGIGKASGKYFWTGSCILSPTTDTPLRSRHTRYRGR